MKIVLIALNAKYIHSNLGIYCLRSYALAHGIEEKEICLKEYTINQNPEEIMADIYRQKPDVIAFSCYIWNIAQIQELVVDLKKILPKVPVWAGGPEVSFDAADFLKKAPEFTGVMIGEGEKTFLELLLRYQKNVEESDFSEIAGLVYREKMTGEIVKTPDREKMSMDEVVFPYYDITGLEHRIIYYETSRGCPFGCSYCLSSVDRKVRLRSMELVEKELQFFLDRRVPQVKFVDRTFNCQRQHTMAIWKYIHEHDNGITNFHFELSADLLNEEEIQYLKQCRPGLIQFEIGVQSTNPDTMREIHRTASLDKIREKVACVYQARNIHQHLDLIAGLPEEDYASFRNSFNDVYAMKPDQLQLGFLKVLKGSPIYQQSQEFGIAFQHKPPYEVLFTNWLPYEDVLRLKQVEDMVERYYNSFQFVASIAYLVSCASTPFDFFQALGAFYHDKGYEGIHQSRMQNYEILWEFAAECEIGEKEIVRQCLIFDLYARENVKSLPGFAREEKDAHWKEELRQFFQHENARKEYFSDYEKYDWKQVSRMMHIEKFDWDFLQYIRNGEMTRKETCILFDYMQRNPLDHQAGMKDVTEFLKKEICSI